MLFFKEKETKNLFKRLYISLSKQISAKILEAIFLFFTIARGIHTYLSRASLITRCQCVCFFLILHFLRILIFFSQFQFQTGSN